MVRKETCPHCKGNRIISVTKSTGATGQVKCPSCSGQGYRVRLCN